MKKFKYFPEFDVENILEENSIVFITYTHRICDGYWYDIVHRHKYIKNNSDIYFNNTDLIMIEKFLLEVKNSLNIPLKNEFIKILNLKPYTRPHDQY
jgi:hypothetical protein